MAALYFNLSAEDTFNSATSSTKAELVVVAMVELLFVCLPPPPDPEGLVVLTWPRLYLVIGAFNAEENVGNMITKCCIH